MRNRERNRLVSGTTAPVMNKYLCLETSLNSTLEYNSLLIVNYVDFKKAFDSIHRPALWKLIRTYGLPQKYIDIFKELYDNSRCCVKTNSGFTDFFEVKTGVQQGDIPSPFFSIFTMDYIMGRAMDNPHFGIRWRDARLTDLDFADDLALLVEKWDVMKYMIEKLSGLSEKVSLRISKEKTKVQIFGDIVDDGTITLDNQDLETVQNFTYLGSIQSCSGDTEVDVNCRIGKACGVFRKLGTVWSSRNISLRLRMRIYTSVVLSTALYAYETWKNTTRIANSLDVFHMNCLRKVLKVKRLDRIRNDNIL